MNVIFIFTIKKVQYGKLDFRLYNILKERKEQDILQRIQNTAARYVTLPIKYEHVTPI